MFTAVGFKFQNKTPSYLTGKTLTLEYEPDNKFDSNAIKILADNLFVGHVSRDYQSVVKDILNTGCYKITIVCLYTASANLQIKQYCMECKENVSCEQVKFKTRIKHYCNDCYLVYRNKNPKTLKKNRMKSNFQQVTVEDESGIDNSV